MAFRDSSKRRNPRRIAKLRAEGKAINDIAERSPEVAMKLLMRSFIYPQRTEAPAATADCLDDAELLEVPFEDETLQGYRWAGDGSGPTVAMFHDWERESSHWCAYLKPLVEKGCTVVAFDAPASGRSPGHRLSLRGYINAVHNFRALTGPWHACVGHGLGAAAILQATAQLSAGERPLRIVTLGCNADSREIFERRLGSLGIDEAVRMKFWRKLDAIAEIPLDSFDNAMAAARLEGVEGLIVHDHADARYPFSDAERLRDAWPGADILELDGFGHELDGVAVQTRLLPFIGAYKLLKLAA